jgi:hypothetical protein
MATRFFCNARLTNYALCIEGLRRAPPVCVADVSLTAIVEGWPAMSAIANAVVGGRLSAVLACERHGTAVRGQKAIALGMNWDSCCEPCISATH